MQIIYDCGPVGKVLHIFKALSLKFILLLRSGRKVSGAQGRRKIKVEGKCDTDRGTGK